MHDAGPEGDAADEVPSKHDAVEIADRYLAEAAGDAHAALVRAVVDGIAISALVSRGFARWGAPERPAARPRRRRGL